MDLTEWADSQKIQLCVGTVVAAEVFAEARQPAYKLVVDFGDPMGQRKSSAQITDLYEAEAIVGKQGVAVVNFPPKQLGPMMSECLVTGFHREDGAVVLAVPEQAVPNGVRLA